MVPSAAAGPVDSYFRESVCTTLAACYCRVSGECDLGNVLCGGGMRLMVVSLLVNQGAGVQSPRSAIVDGCWIARSVHT